MKHIKKFEGFSMQKIIVIDVIIQLTELMWCFNQDVICSDCKEAKDDPTMNLQKHRIEEVKKGNYNYPGIYPNYKPI
jgi:hypothetical protein